MSSYSEAAARVDAGADPRAEATAIVGQMTLDEKLECLDGDLDFWPGIADMIGGGYSEHTYDGGACPRLGVPGIRFSDGPRGVVIGEATCFPVSMARGATWDLDLEERIGDAIGRELRAKGATFYGGVCINLLRHPAWGRAQETYGEDPHLLGEMGAALTRGAQRHVMACVKHYALNSMENTRFKVDVSVDERVLHEVYLPHFRRVVAEGVASVMSAYNSVNGAWCGDNRQLLTEVLREQWGFDGFVISDFIFGLRDAAASVRAGMDIEMPFRMVRHQHLRAQLAGGEITEAEIDTSITRAVATQLRFDRRITAVVREPDVIANPQHRALAREAATKSIVLLRNDGVLPLDPSALRRVAVIGKLAALPNLGDRGSSRVAPPTVVTPLDGLRAALPGAEVVHVDGSDLSVAAAAAAGADAAIVVVGYTHTDEGEYVGLEGSVHLQSMYPPQGPEVADMLRIGFERAAASGGERSMGPGGDRASLRLHADDEALIELATAANPRTIVCVMAGSAVVMPWAERAGAVVLLWYPGMEGGHALADVLLGVACPSGRLPFTIPSDESHLPAFDRAATQVTYDRWHGYTKLQRDGVSAAFPFGFGLSYTSFAVRSVSLAGDDPGVLTAEITNIGSRSGAHVVQVYAGMVSSTIERAEWLLVGFARTSELQPGETRNISVSVPQHALAVWRSRQQDWWVEPGEYRLSAVSHSAELGLDPAASPATNPAANPGTNTVVWHLD